jgi:hypothetical protein
MPTVYKIGLTRAGIGSRISSLDTTSLPVPFECISAFDSDHVLQLERFIHRKMKDRRVSKNREFFFFTNDELVISAVSHGVSCFTPREYTKKEEKHLEVIRSADSPSRQAKAAGLKNLAEVAQMTGRSDRTLANWCRNYPDLFAVVIAGCVALKAKEEL